MASSVGVVYQLDFLVNDKNAKKAIETMQKQAETMLKTLDKFNLKQATKQVENLKEPIKQATKQVQELEKAKKQVGKDVRNPFSKVKKGSEDALKSVNNMMKKIGTGALYRMGSMITQGFSQALKDYSEIDFGLRGASAKSGGFGNDYKDYFKLTNQVGASTKFRNLQVSEALNAGTTLGIKKDEMMAILPATAQLAQAFNTDIPKAMEITKMHMNTYMLDSGKSQKVTDMIAVTAKNSAADIDRLAEGFKYVGGKAKALNIPLEQVYAVLGKMNDSGFTGSTAGTSFNMFLSALGNNKKRSGLEGVLGQKVTDERGNLLELSKILTMISEKTKTMGTADRQGFLGQIFGERGGRTINAFLNQGVEGLKKLQNEIKNSEGAAKSMADYMMGGSAGAIETLMSTLESTFQTLLKALNPLIIPLAGSLTLVAKGIMEINNRMPYLVEFVAFLSAFVVGKAILPLIIIHLTKIGNLIKVVFASPTLLALAVALIVVLELFQRWKEYLSENEEANKSWNKILRNSKYILKSLLDILTDVVFGVLGLSDGQKKAGKEADKTNNKTKSLAEKMEDFNKKLAILSIRLRDLRKYLAENQKAFTILRNVLIGLLVIKTLVGLFQSLSLAIGLVNGALTFLAANPIVAVVLLVIGVVTLLVFWFIKLYKENERFREIVNMVWNFVKEHILSIVAIIVAGPFGILIAGLIELYKNNEDFKNIVDTAWTTIQQIIEDAINVILQSMDVLIDKFKQAGKSFQDFRQTASEKFHGLGNGFGLAQSKIKGFKRNATGTDHFMSGNRGGMTTIDERGDEAIWLPNGSMIANNTTTKDMLNELKSINSGNGKSASVVKKISATFGNIIIHSNDGKKVANELLSQLENLEVV